MGYPAVVRTRDMTSSLVVRMTSSLSVWCSMRNCNEFGRPCGMFGFGIINCMTVVILDGFDLRIITNKFFLFIIGLL